MFEFICIKLPCITNQFIRVVNLHKRPVGHIATTSNNGQSSFTKSIFNFFIARDLRLIAVLQDYMLTKQTKRKKNQIKLKKKHNLNEQLIFDTFYTDQITKLIIIL